MGMESDFTDVHSALSDSVSAYYTTARANALIYFLLSLLVSLMHDEFHTPLSPNQCSPLAGEVRGKGGKMGFQPIRDGCILFSLSPHPSPLTPPPTKSGQVGTL